MNFPDFQIWRNHQLWANPGILDCAETNLYRSLAALQPKPAGGAPGHAVHRCDLARAWLARYEFSAGNSRHAMVSRGVRHALSLILHDLAQRGAMLWLPADVYPAYFDLARVAGLTSESFKTLPEPRFPSQPYCGREEFMLIANPWKPLGRYLTDQECDELENWLAGGTQRHLLMDCVYDLATPFHATTRRLQRSGRAILLQSATKGWLWPKTFGVVLLGEDHLRFASSFTNDPPSQDQLLLGERFLSSEADCPNRVAAALQARAEKLVGSLPDAVRASLLIDPDNRANGGYFFPAAISAEELLSQHHLLAVPASAFGGEWHGSILTSLATPFAPANQGGGL